jgi:hypothetical protein
MPITAFVSVAAAAAAPIVFACNMKALTHTERVQHAANTHRLTAAVVETQEGERSFRFRIAEERMDLTALAEWVRLERKCCPFFTFAIEVEGETGATWLTLSGPPGVKEFIRLELGLT